MLSINIHRYKHHEVNLDRIKFYFLPLASKFAGYSCGFKFLTFHNLCARSLRVPPHFRPRAINANFSLSKPRASSSDTL